MWLTFLLTFFNVVCRPQFCFVLFCFFPSADSRGDEENFVYRTGRGKNGNWFGQAVQTFLNQYPPKEVPELNTCVQPVVSEKN